VVFTGKATVVFTDIVLVASVLHNACAVISAMSITRKRSSAF